ncbi:AraC-like ligand binding domain-containing protein [Chitinophaga sp. CF118]|uniref:AraC family transcriptional regulator n=1 Tax=Chitinophaga sp. CF118 TaxID=1884367 RepID=UPI0008E2F944|nr:helix-turn-helix domain-containing protein [Chitinophaga sp. CF118]SFF02902.1 AraC-like ligand binding domain-containing protein [Chitinophaga sp. CF118]
MKSDGKHIPTYTTESFKDKYFEVDASNDTARRSRVSHFEIHRRDDYHFKCREIIPPNRLDFYMINLITGGEGIKTFGTQEYYLKPGMLCFVSPGMITSWQSLVDNHAGWFCIFTSDFLQQDDLSSYPFFKIGGNAVLHLDETQLQYFNNYFREIEEEFNGDSLQRQDIIKAFLTIILKKSQGIYASPCIYDNSNAGLRLTTTFTKLFEKDFETLQKLKATTFRSLGEYARLLNVSQNHLNDTVRLISGKTPGTLIRERIIKEASQLLIHTQLSIAEICFLFNFEDPSYFTRFFKRYTGITPKQHREKEKQLLV